ncbi:MAG: sulfatase-like hydrolase/transferase [Polyangiales bacterium]
MSVPRTTPRKRVWTAILVIGVALVASLWALRLGPFAGVERGAPTVVFVVMDTLRADRTSLCGAERGTTPTLEGLAELGASYACESHSPATWTLPSHASFFTGRDLDEHRAGAGGGTEDMPWGSVTPLDDRFPTLAEEMSARGYQTLFLSGNPVVNERMGLTRGFDEAVWAPNYRAMQDGRLAARLEHMLAAPSLRQDEPLFVFVNISDPHSPWKGVPAGVEFSPPRPPLSANPGRRQYETGMFDDEEAARYLAHLTDVYDYAILRADRSLSLVLERLNDAGWLDGAYRIVVASDHGEYLGEHQMVEHGRPHLFEPVTRVPLLYFSTDLPVELPADVPAVVAHSLARDGSLPNPMPPKRASTFRRSEPPPEPMPACWFSTAAAWTGTAKLSANRGTVSRFDLITDPDELNPIVVTNGRDATDLLAHCEALDQAYLTRPAPDESVSAELSAQLRALGYLRDDDEPAPKTTEESP